jgi:hypothetical protein
MAATRSELGGMYIHHGFMYASKMSLFGFLPLLLLGKGAPDWAASIAWVACTTLPYAFTAWLQDVLSVKHGFVEFTGAVPEELQRGSETVAYAPLCFTIIGLIYSSGLVAIYMSSMSERPSLLLILTIFTVSFAALMTLPSLAYRMLLSG